MKEINDLLIRELILKNPIFWIVTIFGFFSFIFYKQIIGRAGEHHVKKELKKLPKDKYLIINDLMVIVNDTTHQIDHVVISPYGIFVIETKQYNGYIVGNEYDKKWVQNKKYYINNPIHQNYGHIKQLEEVLKMPEEKFISIVCIPSTAKVKVRTNKNLVLRLYELNEKILSYKKDQLQDYKEIYNKLKQLNVVDKTLRKKHKEYVKEIKNDKETKKFNKCPVCGGDLIEKNGKYGKFIGCSNYPRCHYTKKK